MKATAVAGVVASACLVAACGFVPPAPPMPDNSPRVAVNKTDPRLARATQTGGFAVRQDPPVDPALPLMAAITPIPVPETPPVTEPPATSVAGDPPIAPPASDATPPIPAATSAPALGEKPQTETPVAAPSSTPTSDDDQAPQAVAETASAVEPGPISGPVPESQPVPSPEPEPEPEPVIIKRTWRVSPDDGTVRQALARWAREEGWTFTPERWEVPFDLPIEASADFEAESFEVATQDLSEAIALTESPVRPCFYANRVLRIIPYNQSCDRGGAPLRRQ